VYSGIFIGRGLAIFDMGIFFNRLIILIGIIMEAVSFFFHESKQDINSIN